MNPSIGLKEILSIFQRFEGYANFEGYKLQKVTSECFLIIAISSNALQNR